MRLKIPSILLFLFALLSLTFSAPAVLAHAPATHDVQVVMCVAAYADVVTETTTAVEHQETKVLVTTAMEQGHRHSMLALAAPSLPRPPSFVHFMISMYNTTLLDGHAPILATRLLGELNLYRGA